MHRLLIITAIVTACCAATARGADAGDEPQIEPPTPERSVVCKKVRVTGSHFKKRVCRTRATIDQERADANRFMNNAARYEEAVRMNDRLGQ